MLKNNLKYLNVWAQGHLLGLFVFNTILIVMVLLNVAEYFKPFFFISINAIFFVSLVLSIFLLGLRSNAMFVISLVFFLFGMLLKLAKIEIWADRASIYFYQALFWGIMLLFTSHNDQPKNA